MTVEENRRIWKGYDWVGRGEEWSTWWGDSAHQWRWSILPRIYQYLPADTILEIAPGCGRWTEFLLRHCQRFVGVDLNAECVHTCRARFPDNGKNAFILNNGTSLECCGTHSVDFAFSFDSLVHADEPVIAGYLAELSVKLHRDGVAFIHHSNAGTCRVAAGDRDAHMTAGIFADHCARVGLVCFHQELVDWCTDEFTDCFSTVGRGPVHEPVVIENPHFREEMARAKARWTVLKNIK